MKQIKTIIVFFCLITFLGTTVCAERGEEEKCSIQSNTEGIEEKENIQLENEFLKTEQDIQNYAYLDLDEVSPELVPVVIEARNKIIFRYAWVADGLEGFVYDKNGNIKEKLPQFSELFPEDWSIPILPTGVDLSYYNTNGVEIKGG